ncbi:MAG: HD domain-containing phosphohydrolase [Gemmatimonadales bacterium]
MRPAFYLRSKVGRRVVALFFLSAALPMGLLTMLIDRRLTADLENATTARLVRESKGVGIMVLDRLTGAREVAIELSRELTSERPASAGRQLPPGFNWLAIRGRGGDWRPVLGPASRPVGLAGADLARITAGRSWLAAAPGQDLVMGHRLETDTTAVLFAGIGPTRIWGIDGVNALRPDGRGLCIRLPDGAVLHDAPTGACGDGRDDPATLRGQWTAFLGFEFGAPSWVVSLGEPAAVAMAPVAGFRASFLWVAVLTMAVVFVLANIQIRRSMTPLDQLTESTRRLAGGDLAHRVSVTSRDEFRELADSFNGMAISLDRHVGLLTALQHINHTALANPKVSAVTEVALLATRETFPDAEAIVAMPSGNPSHPWDALAWHGDRPHSRPFRPSSTALASFLRGTNGPPPVGLLGDLPVSPGEHRALAPINRDGEPFGFLCLIRASAPFDDGDRRRLGSLAEQTSVALTNSRLVEQLDEMSWGSLKALARTIDANSPWTAGHSERVTAISLRIATAMGLSEDELDSLHRGGLLHDIGKIGVPGSIIDKAASLTEEERALIQRHPVIGAEILSPLPVFAGAIPIVRWHHEALNGSGYPDRLIGDQIPLKVRILTVGDVWDALTSERPYRGAWPFDEALRFLQARVGSKFDPTVVSVWSDLLRAEPDLPDAIRLPRGAASHQPSPLSPSGTR